MDYICEFCQWQGSTSIGETSCPHCHEEGMLVPVDEWVEASERPDNRQVLYVVTQELNDDTPEIKTED